SSTRAGSTTRASPGSGRRPSTATRTRPRSTWPPRSRAGTTSATPTSPRPAPGAQAPPFCGAERYGPISPATLVDGIEVPVFLTGQWQDEQTGGHFSNMLDDFTGTDQLRATMTNGSHGDALI